MVSHMDISNESPDVPKPERMLNLEQLRLIDLSVSLEHDAAGEMMKPQIEYITHSGAGLQSVMYVFHAEPEDFVYSNGQGMGCGRFGRQ
jgi:hypothetical protein